MRLTQARATMAAVKTYVFLDVETTGLPFNEFGDTKITELTMVAVIKDHISVPPAPRVLNKLTLCINPMKHINQGSSVITGLNNELLDQMPSFCEKTYDQLNLFISRVPQPACLIAHNGDRFDFPILQSHLKYIQKDFPDNLLCADSLKCFRELKVMEQKYPPDNESVKERDEWDDDFCPEQLNLAISEVEKSSPPHLSQIIDDIERSMKCVDNNVNPWSSPLSSPIRNDCTQDSVSTSQELDGKKKDNSRTQFTTPVKQRISVKNMSELSDRQYGPVSDVRNERTPNKQTGVNSSGRTSSVKKSLFKPSYKLSSVFEHVTGEHMMNAHTSEADTLALINIVSVLGDSFHDWVANNCKMFSNISRMW